MFNNEDMLKNFFGAELSEALANTDYVLAVINNKATELMHSLATEDCPTARIKQSAQLEKVTEILQEIKVIMTPAASQEIH